MNPQLKITDGVTSWDLETVTPAHIPAMAKGYPKSFDVILSAPLMGRVVLARVHYTPESKIGRVCIGGDEIRPTPARIDVTSDYPAISALLRLAVQS